MKRLTRYGEEDDLRRKAAAHKEVENNTHVNRASPLTMVRRLNGSRIHSLAIGTGFGQPDRAPIA